MESLFMFIWFVFCLFLTWQYCLGFPILKRKRGNKAKPGHDKIRAKRVSEKLRDADLRYLHTCARQGLPLSRRKWAQKKLRDMGEDFREEKT